MPITHEWPVVGSRNYTTETRAVVDEIEFDLDSLDADITGLQTGALPIALPGITAALGTYEPLQNMRAASSTRPMTGPRRAVSASNSNFAHNARWYTRLGKHIYHTIHGDTERGEMAHGAISPKEPACQTPSSTYEE